LSDDLASVINSVCKTQFPTRIDRNKIVQILQSLAFGPADCMSAHGVGSLVHKRNADDFIGVIQDSRPKTCQQLHADAVAPQKWRINAFAVGTAYYMTKVVNASRATQCSGDAKLNRSRYIQ